MIEQNEDLRYEYKWTVTEYNDNDRFAIVYYNEADLASALDHVKNPGLAHEPVIEEGEAPYLVMILYVRCFGKRPTYFGHKKDSAYSLINTEYFEVDTETIRFVDEVGVPSRFIEMLDVHSCNIKQSVL